MLLGNLMKRHMHFKCRNSAYPRTSNVIRFTVPDDKVSWDNSWDEYQPTNYTAESIKGANWADPDLSSPNFNPNWNSIDGTTNRSSHQGTYLIVNGAPRNPVGRTGIVGRGCLGRWGPNHAADPIVTRWKRIPAGDKDISTTSLKPILQFVAIQRRDNGQWAIPGGMVDAGEMVSATLQREFLEEALNSLEKKDDLTKMVKDFFKDGCEIFKGYVDDPRNTDNAWMETIAVNFHDDAGNFVSAFPFEAGDDAKNVTWMDLCGQIDLYASHKNMLEKVVRLFNAHW